ncbi:serine protease [Neolewinella maritima]|uniref:serine protease n=1 Tax=Neolewinella maritima TaxID=1383882 RepID=UPI001EE90BF1|nr:serine protease [Neolewinella maritima]
MTPLVQLATPFSTGTGLYLADHQLVITNEHVVRSNSTVVVEVDAYSEQLAEVVYLDAYYDLAFLRPRVALEVTSLAWTSTPPQIGDAVTSLAQYMGEPLRELSGELLDDKLMHHGIQYLLHTAREGDTVVGGALLDAEGALAGINMMNVRGSSTESLALPTQTLEQILAAFGRGEGKPAARCFHCREITFELAANPKGFCPNCGQPLVLPSLIEEVTPIGVEATVEEILVAAGHDPRLARRGPNLWRIRQGSATIQVTYHEDSGLITGDAYLCRLPELPSPDLFAFLLRENDRLRQLTFSTYGRDIILSLLIYDRYLSLATALPRFEELFEQADAYDDVLVETYGALWR